MTHAAPTRVLTPDPTTASPSPPQDFIAHMNVLTAILDTKAKRDDIESAMAAVKEQVTAMETGVAQPDLAREVASMKKLLQQKADKSDLVGCVAATGPWVWRQATQRVWVNMWWRN